MSKPNHCLATLLGVAALSCTVCSAHAANGWNEAVSGDLANVGTSPTPVTLGLGSNLIAGSTGRTSGVVDRDYFSVSIAPGQQLSAVNVLAGTAATNAGGVSFIAVQAGLQVTVSPTGGSAAGLLGWLHFGENDLGTNVLPVMGIGIGATGFVDTLPAGNYAFWIQDTGTGTALYRLDFNVSAVPEPATVLMLLAGLAGIAGGRCLKLRPPCACAG